MEDGRRRSSQFNPQLHGARGLFALMIFAFHVGNSGLPQLPGVLGALVAAIVSTFAFGVELFFAISGIVILESFRRRHSLRSFLWRRATRIIPVLWVTIAVVFLMTLAGSDRFEETSPLLLSVWLIANGLALPPLVQLPLIHPAAWSISFEAGFYLMFALYEACRRISGRGTAAIIVTLGALYLYAHALKALFFLPGLLIGAGLLKHPALKRMTAFPVAWLCIFLGCWKLVEIRLGHRIEAVDPVSLVEDPVLVFLTMAAFISALLAMGGIVRGKGMLSRVLRSWPMQMAGTISFSFYLWQTPVLAVVKRAMISSHFALAAGDWAQPLLAALALPLTIAVSMFSRRLLEERATLWLRRIRNRRTSTQTLSDAVSTPIPALLEDRKRLPL